MKHLKVSAILILLAISPYAMTQCPNYDASTNDLNDLDSEKVQILKNTLSDEEKEAILLMREEEKLARDVYLHLYDIFPLRPFSNISKSEQAHMDAMLYLIDLYGLEDPVKEKAMGEFTNKELQVLYDELVLKGKQSRVDALEVAALIEEVDIIDLQNALSDVGTHDELNRVYSNLYNASKNHLRAFVRVLRMNGVEYEPSKLGKEQFLTIIEN
jgi:hypothetical protein